MITKEQIIQDLKEYKQKYNKIPTKSEYQKCGKFSRETVVRKFGNWNAAIKEIFNTVLHQSPNPKIKLLCHWCENEFIRCHCHTKNHISKSSFYFCSSSCAASYNNTQRKKSRRSKIEIKLFEQLEQAFPNLIFLPNDKTMLNGLEVDIAVPSLKLAIEWNGIVHFKPIYGQVKLDKIQTIDQKKLIIAQQKDINLIVITDLVSNQKQFDDAFKQISLIVKELS
jgi:hypothetical protein